MNIHCTRVLALAAATALSAGAFAQSDAQPSQSKSGQQQQQQQQQPSQSNRGSSGQSQGDAPEGFVLVEERVILLTANEPQNHFLEAQQALAQNNAKLAAAETNIAAGYLEMQASRAGGQAKQNLTNTAEHLRQVAGQIGKQGGDAQKQQQQLAKAFADASMALSSHHHSKATGFIQNDKPVMAGHDLRAAADALAAAYAFGQKQPSQEVTDAIAQAQQLATRLTMPDLSAPAAQSNSGNGAQQAAAKQQGGDAIPQDADKTIQSFAKVLESASKELPPSQQSKSSSGGASNASGQ